LITTITQSIRVNGSDAVRLNDLFVNLLDESKRLKAKDSSFSALVARHTKNKKNRAKPYDKSQKDKNSEMKCNHCHKEEHKAEAC
jgi:hypothetical protein